MAASAFHGFRGPAAGAGMFRDAEVIAEPTTLWGMAFDGTASGAFMINSGSRRTLAVRDPSPHLLADRGKYFSRVLMKQFGALVADRL